MKVLGSHWANICIYFLFSAGLSKSFHQAPLREHAALPGFSSHTPPWTFPAASPGMSFRFALRDHLWEDAFAWTTVSKIPPTLHPTLPFSLSQYPAFYLQNTYLLVFHRNSIVLWFLWFLQSNESALRTGSVSCLFSMTFPVL